MKSGFSILLELIKLSFKSPKSAISKINVQNFRILYYAIKHENREMILANFKKLLGLANEPKIEESTYILPENEQKANVEIREIIVEKVIKEKEYTFYNQWDDSYISKHHNRIESAADSIIKHIDLQFVAIIADLNLPQCKKYRVIQKIELLKRNGIPCNFSHWLDVPRSLNLMQNASTVIFYRIPFSKLTESYIDEALRLEIKIGYDIDDPIFDKVIYSQNTNLDFLDISEKKQLIKNAKHYASVLRQVDFITTSTPFLKEILGKYSKASIHIWRNLMDAQSLNAAEVALNLSDRQIDEKKFVIGYMSGSRAHEADFDVVNEALIQIMSDHKHVHFKIVGYAALAKKLENKFKDRVSYIPYTEYYDYIASFLTFDINIIPLVQNQFNECKSAIRYLEASLLEIPSMITFIGDFKHIVKHKETGMFIYKNSKSEWIQAIEWAIKNKSEFREMGVEAKKDTLQNYSTKSVQTNSPIQKILESEF